MAVRFRTAVSLAVVLMVCATKPATVLYYLYKRKLENSVIEIVNNSVAINPQLVPKLVLQLQMQGHSVSYAGARNSTGSSPPPSDTIASTAVSFQPTQSSASSVSSASSSSASSSSSSSSYSSSSSSSSSSSVRCGGHDNTTVYRL